MYAVTRQHYWGYPEDEAYVVEIVYGGLDQAGPDMLCPRYPGEAKTYADPREAARVAIDICRRWRKDGQANATIGVGYTWGGSLPVESTTEGSILAWAEKEYKELLKCDRCGEILSEDYYRLWDFPDRKFCSDYCAEEFLWENS